MQDRIGVAILAAGSSSRLGQPKQLLKFEGSYLLQRMVDEVVKLNLLDLVLIVGANADQIRSKVNAPSFDVVQNNAWEKGMSSSIRVSVELAIRKNLDGLLIVLSDQPYVNSELLQQIIQFYEPKKNSIVASEYDNILGVPALFDRMYFEELLKLEGDTGARKLINVFRDKVKAVKFEMGGIDIDIPEDLNQLKS